MMNTQSPTLQELPILGSLLGERRVDISAKPMGAPNTKLPGSLAVQVGGDHYKTLQIQPVEFITKNNLGFIEGNVVKYITRHKHKGGAADVRKALHYCQMLLELQYGEVV